MKDSGKENRQPRKYTSLAAGREWLLIRLAPGCPLFSERRSRLGGAWLGEAGLGVVPIKHLREGLDRNCPNGHLAGLGEAGLGWAGQGVAWLGEAWRGEAMRGKKYDNQRNINNNRGYFTSVDA